MRMNCSMDACHLFNDRGCLTDIIQTMADGEMLLDTFTLIHKMSVGMHGICP